jgi:hypothetical protein
MHAKPTPLSNTGTALSNPNPTLWHDVPHQHRYGHFIEASKVADPTQRLLTLSAALEMLPLYNFMTLKLLVQHLHRLAS